MKKIFHANGNQKKTILMSELAILISDKIEIFKNCYKTLGRPYIMIKGSIQKKM